MVGVAVTQWNKARCGNPTGKRSGACSCSYCEGYADAARGEVTWCADRIHERDVAYVRADLAVPTLTIEVWEDVDV